MNAGIASVGPVSHGRLLMRAMVLVNCCTMLLPVRCCMDWEATIAWMGCNTAEQPWIAMLTHC